MFRNPRFVILFLCFLCISPVWAQQVARYDIPDGLPHQQVKTLYQDSRGYLWIGTWDGVSRFDGHSFTTWRHDSRDSTTIFNDEVCHITEDSTHTIWVTTIRGPAKFNALHNNFERVYFKKSDSVKYNGISKHPIAFDRNNRGWFLDKDGLVCFNADLSKIKHFDLPSSYTSRGTIIADSNGLWLGLREGIFHFKHETLGTTSELNMQLADRAYTSKYSATDEIRGGFLRTYDSKFIISINNRYLCISNDETMEMETMILPIRNQEPQFEFLNEIYEYSPGRVTLCTDNKGLQIFNLKTNSFEFGHPLQEIVGEQTVYTIFRDRQRNYWVGTQNGLIKYAPPQLNFDAWLYQPDSTNTLSRQFVSSIYLDDENILWAACRGGGLDRIDPQTNQITNINLDAIADKVGAVSNARYVYGLTEELLVLEIDSKLFIYNKMTGTPEFLLDNPDQHIRFIRTEKTDFGLLAGKTHSLPRCMIIKFIFRIRCSTMIPVVAI